MPVADPITDAVLAGIAVISADAIICIDETQRITFFNEGAEQIFGYGRDEAIGQPIEMLIPTRHRPSHREHVKRFGQSPMKARRMGERSAIAGVRKTVKNSRLKRQYPTLALETAVFTQWCSVTSRYAAGQKKISGSSPKQVKFSPRRLAQRKPSAAPRAFQCQDLPRLRS